MIARIIKHGFFYHAIILDSQGKTHHKKFKEKSRAYKYVEAYYYDHKRVVVYEI